MQIYDFATETHGGGYSLRVQCFPLQLWLLPQNLFFLTNFLSNAWMFVHTVQCRRLGGRFSGKPRNITHINKRNTLRGKEGGIVGHQEKYSDLECKQGWGKLSRKTSNIPVLECKWNYVTFSLNESGQMENIPFLFSLKFSRAHPHAPQI